MLEKLGKFVVKNHKLVLIISLLITIVSIWGVSKLKIRTQMYDMLPKNEPMVKLYQYSTSNFHGLDTIILAVQGQNKRDIINYIEAVSPEIKKITGVDRVIDKNEIGYFEKNGLLLLSKNDDLNKMKGMLTASSLKDFVAGLNDNLETTYTNSGDSKKLSKDKTQLFSSLATSRDFAGTFSSKGPDKNKVVENSNEFLRGPKYLISSDGKMGLVLIRTSVSMIDMEPLEKMVNTIEKTAWSMQDRYNVKATLSGNHVIQRDELVTTKKDTGFTSLLSLVLIILIFYVGFKIIRFTLLAVVPLIVGIIWALGLAYFVIGSLNLFTAMVGAILIGLGIDYAIHIISIFSETGDVGMVYQKVARGVITGAVTTALGFGLFIISSFAAFKEFGFVLAAGIITTLLASLFILPALLVIFPLKVKGEEKRDLIGEGMSIIERNLTKKPVLVIILVFLLFVLALFGIPRVQFDSKLESIEAKGLPSIEINKVVREKFNFGMDSSVFISKDLKGASGLKQKLDDLSAIGLIDSISNYVPAISDQKIRITKAQKLKVKVQKFPDKSLYPEKLKKELLRLEKNMIELSDLSYIGGEKDLVAKFDDLVKSKVFQNAANAVSDNRRNIEKFQNWFIGNLQKKVLASNTSRLLSVPDVPKQIVENYIGDDGNFLTIAYPSGDPWDMNYQEIYLAQLESLGEKGYDTVSMMLKVMWIAGEEGRFVLILTAIFMYIVLLLDFRSFKYATMAILPMLLTLGFMVGIMGWLGIKFNFVNVIALPMIIGIGVDDGVHLIHRYLIERNITTAIRSTGRAITMTTATTIAAFGTLMLASYQGYSSMAKVLSLGIFLAYAITVVLLPALIILFDKEEIK